ncbi:MAG: rRNA ((967)-C(5))-methyltransferase [Gammaproteobacteria bacterium]|jgi:16S rRNA (cytosine967-C5)-methyltransferase|nr:rRNA ((967)-C(5))-methyltransferase [Gammaproteobacteria bacterium]
MAKYPKMSQIIQSRAIAATILSEVLINKHSMQHILSQNLADLNKNDAAFVQALVYGVVREYGNLQAILKCLIDKPLKAKEQDTAILILMGLYQLMSMRVAEHAAVSETVNAAKILGKQWAVSLINGTLRRFAREKESILAKAKLSPMKNYPAWLVEKIKTAWPDRSLQILQKNDQNPPMHIRVNQQKTSREAYLELLAEKAITAIASPLSSSGITLEQAVGVEQLPHFSEGWVSVQDIAAQQAAYLLELSPALRVLDACAAPGGKTAHILECEPKVELMAIDQDAHRLQKVEDNLSRLGLSAKVLSADASKQDWWDKKTFDRILIDAPCSATGVIRRHPDIKWLRHASDIPKLAELQLCILKNLWTMLSTNGILVYATCSLLPEENDQIISQFISDEPSAKVLPLQFAKGTATKNGWQFFPEHMGTDGFFYSKIIKQ